MGPHFAAFFFEVGPEKIVTLTNNDHQNQQNPPKIVVGNALTAGWIFLKCMPRTAAAATSSRRYACSSTSRVMPCAHRKVDLSQHRATPRPRKRIRVVEEEAARAISWGLLPARKETLNVPTSGRATTTAVPASMHNNWLGRQQTAATAASCYRAGCCFSVLL